MNLTASKSMYVCHGYGGYGSAVSPYCCINIEAVIVAKEIPTDYLVAVSLVYQARSSNDTRP